MRTLYWNEGASQNVLAEAFGISQAGVSQIVRGDRYGGLPMPDTTDRSTEITVNDPKAKEIESIAEEIQAEKDQYTSDNLDPGKVTVIRTQFWTNVLDGKTLKQAAKHLADRYGVCSSHIKNIARGRKWKYVSGPTSREEAKSALALKHSL
jgi:transcriptional regulator with XRE-family HTH domain